MESMYEYAKFKEGQYAVGVTVCERGHLKVCFAKELRPFVGRTLMLSVLDREFIEEC